MTSAVREVRRPDEAHGDDQKGVCREKILAAMGWDAEKFEATSRARESSFELDPPEIQDPEWG